MEETLSDYVKRVMKQKNLGVRDIERNSAKRITASHVSKVLSGSISNLTADKVVGLAAGLQVDPHEVFSVISGHPVSEAGTSDLARFADIMQKLAIDPELLETCYDFVRLDKKDRDKLREGLRFMSKRNQKPQRKRKKR
jgi:transcriptional regulator with XRE-family HTH domain